MREDSAPAEDTAATDKTAQHEKPRREIPPGFFVGPVRNRSGNPSVDVAPIRLVIGRGSLHVDLELHHVDRSSRSLVALVAEPSAAAVQSLLHVIDSQHAEGDRHVPLDLQLGNFLRDALTDEVEMARIPLDDAAECDHGIDQYGSTPSGNLAKHYAGICYLRTGDLENAAAYLAKFSPVKGIPGALINAQNYGLQGDVAVEQQNYAAAVKFYEKAVAAADNNMTAPMYLRKAGLAEQAQGNTEKAAAYYERILTSYPASMEAREAEKLLGGATK